jgi:transcriptional regulator NrdR family protein
MCVCLWEKLVLSQCPKADGLRKKLQTSRLEDPCTRAARRRELAAFSTCNNRILGAEELPVDVIRRDTRRGRNTHPSDEHVNILLRLEGVKVTSNGHDFARQRLLIANTYILFLPGIQNMTIDTGTVMAEDKQVKRRAACDECSMPFARS